MLSDYFWYYGTWIYGIIIIALALYLSKKKGDRIFFILLIINTIFFFISNSYPAGYLVYFYFIFIGLRGILKNKKLNLYKKKDTSKING